MIYERFSHFDSTRLTPFEAKSLVALLHSKDEAMLERALTTIGNHGTFEDNQVREEGVPRRVAKRARDAN